MSTHPRPAPPSTRASTSWLRGAALCAAAALLSLLVPACQRGPYTTVAECEALDSGPRQDACWMDVLPPMFRDRASEAENLARTRISDPAVRDYLWLTVTRDIDPGSMKYCNRIEDAAMKDRCRVLVSRPHLHRELSGQMPAPGGAGGGPGGQPPSGGAPPTGPSNP